MKKILILFASLFLISLQAQEVKTIKLKANQSKVQVSSVNDQGFLLTSSLSDVTLIPVQKKDNSFYQLKAKGLIKTYNVGMPDIPVISKLIEVPLEADVSFEIIGYREEIINLNNYGIRSKIIPAQRSLSKNEQEGELELKKEVYNTDDFLYKETAKYYESGIMRNIRMGRIEIHPIQYNPVKNTLKILNNLQIKVIFNHPDMAKTKELKKKTYSPVFGNFLKTSLINYRENKELITQSPLHYVIVADRMFENQLAPFIEWKQKKGFEVTVGYTDQIGNTTSDIKTWLQNIYQGSNPMSYVLFVGDVAQIPAWAGNSGSHVTDLRYCEYTGDNLPEVYYGRFSATTTAELQPQIDKTLMYEKYLMPDPSYLNEVFLVAGDDESHEDTFGNGQINYGADNYFNSANNLSAHVFLQDPPTGNNGVHDSIIANVNMGLAFANYTAHCSPDGWAEPSFSVSDVNSLNNDGKYGMWIGNCCLSNKFDDAVCFGEAALRKANGGAIGYIGGSNSTYWDEDYWWGVGLTTNITANPTYNDSGRGAYDGMMHTLANEVNDPNTWYPAQGQIQVCGNLAVEASTSTRKEYYWEIYHLMGDPSVMNYIGVPPAMNVSLNPSTLLIGMTSLSVTSAPYTYVALSQNGVIIATAMSDSNGNATLNFDANDISVGNADLVITGQNLQPYIGTIQVSPADQPYIVLDNYSTDTDVNYGSTIHLNVDLKNVANTGSGNDTQSVTAIISSTDTYITINDNTEDFGAIVAGNVVSRNNAYEISIADNIPDQHIITIDMLITDTATNNTWNASINLTANAPAIHIGEISVINDPNGNEILDPGETADLKFQIENTGHADAVFNGILSELSDPNNYLTLSSTTVSGINIPAGQTSDFIFTNAGADAATPLESVVQLTLDVTAGANNQYTNSSNQDLVIGLIPIFPISDGGTITTCTGTFYDSGLDTANYQNSEDYTMTFLPPAGQEFIVVEFNSFETENNYDKLYVYLGADTNAPEMQGSPFMGTNSPGRIESNNGITFHFTSDSSVNRSGWEATVSCFTPTSTPDCVTNPVPADQATNVFPTEISWTASPGTNSYDVYFGTDPNPLTNTPVTVNTTNMTITTNANTTYYWTVLPTNNFGTTTGCDVWSFTTGNAQYFMTDGLEVITCDAMFYDEGGPNNNYSNGLDQTMTFRPDTSNMVISAYFNSFDVELGSSGTQYDYLEVYDGINSSAPLIGKFSADDGAPVPTELQPVIATNPDGALTFVFHSDGSLSRAGWDASISCVNPAGVIENKNYGLHIYPNPNKGNFTISLPENQENITVEVFSIGGKSIYKQKFDSSDININLGNYTKGIYFVKVIAGNTIYNSKLIIE
jgi:hypothetical protein